MSEPTKEALELAEHIESSSYFEADFLVFNTTEAARKIDEGFASLREELRAAREDSARLDWLETQWGFEFETTDKRKHFAMGVSLRPVIDAARRARAACKGGDAV